MREAGLREVRVQILADADTKGHAAPILLNMAKYARESGRLPRQRIDAFVDDVKSAIADGSYLLVLPQFLVTGVAAEGGTRMKFGLFGINTGPCARPDTSAEVARAAEAAGFESVWTGEHVVLPDPQVPPSPVPPQTPLLDPAVSLAFLAAHTNAHPARHRDHHPAAAQSGGAREGARERRRGVERTPDLRLGVGYLKPEFDAIGADFATGARAPTSTSTRCSRSGRRRSPPSRADGRASAASRRSRAPCSSRTRRSWSAAHAARAPRRRAGNGWYGFAMDVDAATRQTSPGSPRRRSASRARPHSARSRAP